MEEEGSDTRVAAPLPFLGVDVGGVLVPHQSGRTDTSFFGTRPLETPAVDGAIDGLRQLVELFDRRVAIVSKAGSRISQLTSRWMWSNDLFGKTGLDPGALHFVRTRPDKGPVCFSLGVTHFIDDRLDVLEALPSVANRYLFTGGRACSPAPAQVPKRFVVVDSWPALVARLRGSVGK